MRALVLGSDGQIGRPLTRYLRECGHDVVELDNYSNRATDLRTPGLLDYLLEDIDFVFFLAYDVGGSVYLKGRQDSFEFISNNVKIMNNTFDSLRRFDTPFIFASSQMSGMSHSTYGLLKRIGEKYTESMNGKTLKFWNVYGVDREGERSHVINDFIQMAMKQGRIDMRTDGKESRQFLYAGDCSKCLCTVMERFGEIKEKQLDVSSFEWVKIIDVARIIAGIFDKCEIQKGTEVDDLQRNALKEPGKEILKYWKPEMSLMDGILNVMVQTCPT